MKGERIIPRNVSAKKLIRIRCVFKLWVMGALFAFFCFRVFADDTNSAKVIDPSKLPPAAHAVVDFKRDIQPIFDSSCLRCHGPERPKSRFRLDNRDSALKGGEHGVDIIPGNSAKSPLIHYVAYLVEDMEMPPPAKSKQLTGEQIGFLRAWIDQGAKWEGQPTNFVTFSASPVLGGTAVSGDAAKFREHYWQKEGVNGGADIEQFQQVNPDTSVLMTAHVLRDDYKPNLSLDRNDFGFIHTGWQSYRKYYDDTGGYYPALNPPTESLNRDLYLDIGKAWIDFGLTLPHWPRMVLGYEYDYREGNEAITDWGGVIQNGVARNIAPASKEIHEGTHVIKFDLDKEVQGVAIEERFRGEFYKLNTSRTNTLTTPFVGNLQSENVGESSTYFQGANTIRLEKKVNNWWLVSGGYLYSKLNSDASFSLNTATISGLDIGDQQWSFQNIRLSKESDVVNVNSLFGPFNGLTISTGAQTEWSRQEGFGSGNMNVAFPGSALLLNPTILSSDYDEVSVMENIGLRYSKIPFTALFADARFEQQRIGQNDQLADGLGDNNDFLQDTTFSSQITDLRAGFETSPWQNVSFSAHYRRYEDDSRYQNSVNEQPIGFDGAGYPGFLNSRDLLTDEVEAKLVLRPSHWLKTSLSYQYSDSDYRVGAPPVFAGISPGGELSSGEYASRTYSLNATFTPWPRFYFDGTFAYGNSTAVTASSGATAIAPYKGDTYSVIVDGTYNLSAATDLFAAYSFSEANYGQNNFSDGLPVGLEYQQHQVQVGVTHRWKKNVSSKLQYIFAYYAEPSSGGAANYRANAIFATLTFKLP